MIDKDKFNKFASNIVEKPRCLDSRDAYRILYFLPYELAESSLKEEYRVRDKYESEDRIPYTEENIVRQLVKDARFGKEKAEMQRGISSSFMHSICTMWLTVLEDTSFDDIDYGDGLGYGLDLFDAVLNKYGE